MKFTYDWKINKFNIIYIHPHLLSKYLYFKFECHLIMMDNEVVTVNENENMMMGPKYFFNFV
jgi:hypothetical protein